MYKHKSNIGAKKHSIWYGCFETVQLCFDVCVRLFWNEWCMWVLQLQNSYLHLFELVNYVKNLWLYMSSIKVASMNCRGLGDLAKRKDVFNFLKQKAYSIYCIQDTHFTAKEESFIRSMWGFEIYNCPGTSESRGWQFSSIIILNWKWTLWQKMMMVTS